MPFYPDILPTSHPITDLEERVRAWQWTIEHNPKLGWLHNDLRREIAATEAEIERLKSIAKVD